MQTASHLASAPHVDRSRRRFIQTGALALGASLIKGAPGKSRPTSPTLITQADLKPLTYGTNWYAQAEHGGFYQALATGIYQKAGLAVTIEPGGPQINGIQSLVGGRFDCFMGSGIEQLIATNQNIPLITVAAIFQKDPQVLLAHPNQGIENLEDLRGKPIFVSSGANSTFWPFLVANFGFTDDQKRPYNFSLSPFLSDPTSAQQGYLTSEPYAIQIQAGFQPMIFLLADYGYGPYTTTIQTTQQRVFETPDLIERFVDASIEGWYSYLADPGPGNQLIKEANPEMTDAQITYGINKMQEFGIVLSGDAETLGIGAMTDQRWQTVFENLVAHQIVSPDLNLTQAYTLRFINKGTEVFQPPGSES